MEAGQAPPRPHASTENDVQTPILCPLEAQLLSCPPRPTTTPTFPHGCESCSFGG
jgi:hypothetical protein